MKLRLFVFALFVAIGVQPLYAFQIPEDNSDGYMSRQVDAANQQNQTKAENNVEATPCVIVIGGSGKTTGSKVAE